MTTLYRFFDADDRLLYVGIAGTATQRWEQHAKEKGWWDSVARVTVENHPSRQAAADAERNAIRNESPLYNVVHNRNLVKLKQHDLIWYCDVCRAPISDGAGYVQSVKALGRKWVVLHRACDPFPDDPGYWIAVERYRTEEHQFDWFRHLAEKCWFDKQDWWELGDRSLRFAHELRPDDTSHALFLRALRAYAATAERP